MKTKDLLNAAKSLPQELEQEVYEMTNEEIKYAWAAGIIEGEGCLNFYKDKRSNYYTTRVVVEMTDLDIIQKLQNILGGKYVSVKQIEGRKASWRWYINKQKEVFDCLLHILPFLGKRRLEKAKEIFSYLEPKVVL